MLKLLRMSVKQSHILLVVTLILSALLAVSVLYLQLRTSPLSANDHYRVIAERALAEGEQLHAAGNAESQREAIRKYEEALAAWKAANDKQEEAHALKNIGDVYHSSGEPKTALKYYEQALPLIQGLNDRKGEGETLNAIGYAYLSLGENQKALEYCTQALKISQATANRQGEARALNDIGEIYYGFGNLQQSLRFYEKSLPLWRNLTDRRGQAQTLLNFGYTYSDLGEPQKASDFYKQALSLWQALNDPRGQALTLTGIGRLHSRLGESQEALGFFNQAMPLAQLTGDRIEQARILNGLGYVYESLGEKQNAIEQYIKALDLFQSASYRPGEASTLNEIGRCYYSMGNNRKAFDYFQRLLSETQASANRRLMSYALRGIGMTYDSEGSKRKALEYYIRALPLYQEGKDRRGEAVTLNLIGRIYHGWGRKHKALDYYYRALLLNQAARDQLRESLTLYNIACLERDRGKTTSALSQIKTSLQIVESLRTKVTSRELRTSYFASIQQYYELYIDLLMSRKRGRQSGDFDVIALEASERARARSLLELLAEAHADIRQGGDPALIHRARALQQQIIVLAERKMRLLNANASQDEVATVTREISVLTSERDQIEAQIRVKSPHYAALTQPQPSSLKEIQQLLDDDTLLLEYALGGEYSYLWAVTRTGVKSYELPSRAEIEKVARPVYDLLSPQPNSDQPEKPREAKYWRQASALSRIVLKPVADQLGNKRLLIVADGVLQYIPFAALPIPERGRGGDKGTKAIRNPRSATRNPQSVPLMVEHEIVNLPSASTLAVLRRETAGRRLAPKAVAALADPVFEVDDMRVLAATGKVKGAPDKQAPDQGAANLPLPLARLRGMKRDGGFGRLPATLNEARAIEEVTIESERLIAKGFDASRARATDPMLSQYRIIHFATHGILDRDNPELSAIVLSLVDRQGRPQDGYLRLHDIYNLNLPAELVVLSACDTGLGKEFKGEGLIGLTRGFMYAGAARVMASLWKVEDEPTAKLMRHFYRHMLRDGLPPAAALRQAQIALWQDAEWRAPYFWAAFVIQGEWR